MHVDDGTDDAGGGSSAVRWIDVEPLLREDAGRGFGCRVLDVRADRRHVPGSASLPVPEGGDWADALPAGELAERRHPLVVLAETPARAHDAAVHLRARGWDARACVDPVPEAALRDGPAPGRLWRPDPFLESLVPRLPPPAAGPVLDLGGGSGRDACFLASRGYRCVVVDWLAEALDLARARARRMDVQIETRGLDLRDPAGLEPGFAVALSIRFLEREALRRLTYLVVPGGLAVMHTFGPSDRAGEPGRIRARFRLAPVELPELFPPGAWSVEEGPHAESRDGEPWLACALRRT